MKHILGITALGLALGLTGCGGDSDSSGAVYNTGYFKTLSNGNQYQCSNATTKNSCVSDTSCLAQQCTLTKEVVPPVVTPPVDTLPYCNVSALLVTGITNSSCRVVKPMENTSVKLTCGSLQATKIVLDGTIKGVAINNATRNNGMTVNTYRFTCPYS